LGREKVIHRGDESHPTAGKCGQKWPTANRSQALVRKLTINFGARDGERGRDRNVRESNPRLVSKQK